MSRSSNWKTTALPSKLYKKIEEVVKNSPDYMSVSEFVRRAVSDLLNTIKENS